MEEITRLIESDERDDCKVLEEIGDLGRTEEGRKEISEFEGDLIIKYLFSIVKNENNNNIIANKFWAFRALGNICYSGNRKDVAQDSMPFLLDILSTLTIDDVVFGLRTCVGALANFTFENPKTQQMARDDSRLSKLLMDLLGATVDSTVRSIAITALVNLSDDVGCRKNMIANGALESLIRSARGDVDMREELLSIFKTLAQDEEAASGISEKSAIRLLVDDMIQSSTDSQMRQGSLEILEALTETDWGSKHLLNVPNSSGPSPLSRLLALSRISAHPPTTFLVNKIASNLCEHQPDLVDIEELLPLSIVLIRKWHEIDQDQVTTTDDNHQVAVYEESDTEKKERIQKRMQKIEDLLSGLKIVGNLASSDQRVASLFSCSSPISKELIQILSLSDVRIQHMVLGALRNFALFKDFRPRLLAEGIFQKLVDIITVKERPKPNAPLHFSAISCIKVLLVGKGIFDDFTPQALDELLKLDALPPLMALATRDDIYEMPPGENNEPDRRVQYETTRVLIRFLQSRAHRLPAISAGSLPPVLELLRCPHEILQAEALKVLLDLTTMTTGDEQECSEIKNALMDASAPDLLSKFQHEHLSVLRDKILQVLPVQK